jgi:hypothetical protein
MDQKSKYRLRIQNCIWTIIDVHNTISDEFENGEFISQFEDLEVNILALDMTHVSEIDVMMVEQATNALLGEFRPIFESREFGPVYELKEN